MEVFKTYFIINLAFLFLHFALYVVTIMGLGSGNADTPRSEIVHILLLITAIGLLPNMLLFFAAFLRKQHIRENMIWAAVFLSLTLIGYFLAFWPLALEYPV